MKYALLKLRIRHGEYEFYSAGVHEVGDEDLDKWADYMASMEYAHEEQDPDTEEWTTVLGEKWDGFNGDVYFFNGAEIAVKVHSVQEISKEHYDVLKQYI